MISRLMNGSIVSAFSFLPVLDLFTPPCDRVLLDFIGRV